MSLPPTIFPSISGVPTRRGSTTLSSAITSYDLLATRIKRSMGYPSISIEVCDDNIFDAIDQALEWYTKYAGYTQEYLIFHSSLYEHGLGVKLDRCFNITPDFYSVYTDPTSGTVATGDGTITNTWYSPLFTDGTTQLGTSAMYDYDLNNYRKVMDVFVVEQGETSGINTLFTLEQSMAQQVYSTFLIGNVGFDLVTWHVLKDWLDNRSKMLAQIVHYRFNPDNQYLKLVPEPGTSSAQWQDPGYYGLIGCYVERPIRTLLRERWVQRYVQALIKIQLGHIRGKYSGTVLFGGGTVNAADLMSQGLDEKEKLETEILTQFGEVEPIPFLVG